MNEIQLPLPPHYDGGQAGLLRKVPYQKIAGAAREWSRLHGVAPACSDGRRVGLLLIDCQLTFCHPEFELYVGGRSGSGAQDDMRRLTEFIYRNLGRITAIHATLDTHRALQIFFDSFFIDAVGGHPAPMTMISREELMDGRWRANPEVARALGLNAPQLQRYLEHYAGELEKSGKFQLTVWPYHAMQGGIGHALVPELEEACFFHSIARGASTHFETKGLGELTENYSALRPEVMSGPRGEPIGAKNEALIEALLGYDVLIIAGEAKSHCVAWTVEDLRREIEVRDPRLAEKIYLLEDCTSPVVVPGVVDFTEAADAAYERFRAAGMRVVKSTAVIADWLEMQ